MPGVLLRVAYDGADFSGWAAQPANRSVQATLLDAVRENDPSVDRVRGASRTDAGVHALDQWVAFDAAKQLPPDTWQRAINRYLPSDVRVMHAARAPDGFEPRFAAAWKHYRYAVDGSRHPAPHLRRAFWQTHSDRARLGKHPTLDLEAMRRAAQHLIGRHDFKAFRGTGDLRENTRRTLFRIDIRPVPNDAVLIDVVGDAFLKNMVRIIAGTLVAVAAQRLAPEQARQALETGRREDLGPTAPAHGLCLMHFEPKPEVRHMLAELAETQ